MSAGSVTIALAVLVLEALADAEPHLELPPVGSCDGRAAVGDMIIVLRFRGSAVALELPDGPRRLVDADSAAAIITQLVNRHRLSHIDSEEPHPIPIAVVAEPTHAAAWVTGWMVDIDRALAHEIETRVRWEVEAAAQGQICAFPVRIARRAPPFRRWAALVAAARHARTALPVAKP
jgi:hypothetical protein